MTSSPFEWLFCFLQLGFLSPRFRLFFHYPQKFGNIRPHITEKVGFGAINSISRLFRKYKYMSPAPCHREA